MIAEYSTFKKPVTPQEWEEIRKQALNPNTPSGREMLYEFYRKMGMDVKLEDIFNFD